jgi:F0F1-type ATP synthase assembly protein I
MPYDVGPKNDGKGDVDVSFLTVIRQAAHYAIVGIMFPVSIALGFFAGYMIDRWLETVPLFAVIGLCFGVAAAIRNLLQTVASDKNV